MAIVSKISSVWKGLKATTRVGCLFFILGIIAGAGGVGYAAYRQSTALRSELGEYKLIVAARNRKLELLNGELVIARALADGRAKLDEERKQLDAEIEGIVRGGEKNINAAVGEYNKTIERLKLHERVFNALRRYYDPGYNPGKAPGG